MKNSHNYPLLHGIKVIELDGYLPVSFLGKALHDLGADVYLIKPIHDNSVMKVLSYLHEGKRSITLNLKDENQIKIFRKLLQKSDILIDGYRPGVLEKLDLDPKDLLAENPQLITVRVTGYGQEGLMHAQPGHEINYLSLAGTLDFFKSEDNKILNPIIIMGDLFCGSIMPIFHISQALLNRKLNGGQGCIIDSSITTNLLSLSTITNKFVEKDKFYFSVVTKNYDYVLFFLKNDDNLDFNLKRICERLIIEVLNQPDVSEGTRLSITRDYIDFFQLITKSQSESIKYIKDLCRMISKYDIINNFKKFKTVEVYPILQHKNLIKFFEDLHLIKGDKVVPPFKIYDLDKKPESLDKNGENYNLNLETNMIDVLRNMGITEKELAEYIQKEKVIGKPKL